MAPINYSSHHHHQLVAVGRPRGTFSSLLYVVMVLCSVLLVGSYASVGAQALGVANGYPYALCFVTMQNTAPFNIDFVKEKVAIWIPAYDNRFRSLNGASEVLVEDVAITGSQVEFKLTAATRFGNGYIDQMLQTLTAGSNAFDTHLNNIMGTNYTLTSRTVVENASPDVAISFDEFGREYINSWTKTMTMRVDFSPKRNTKLVITFTNPDVTVSPYPLVITWPERTTTFRMFSSIAGNKIFIRSVDASSTDTVSRYQFYVYIPTLQVDNLENIIVTPPSGAIPNYNNTKSNPFVVTVPSTYRDATLNLVVTIRAYPTTMIVSPSNLTITRRNVQTFFFTVTAPIGTYTLNYTIAPPWNSPSTNNNYFNQPTYQHTVVYRAPLNITTQSIEDGYMAHLPVTNDYGGAYSRENIIHIESLPKVALTITIVAPGCQSSPLSITFFPVSRPFAYFRLRGLYPGLKDVQFVLSGVSAADYDTPKSRTWMVHGRNPICYTLTTSSSCFQALGCSWNEIRGFCVNTTVPILIDSIPTLFDQESSSVLNVTLATPVRTSLTVTFAAVSRLIFSPARITLPAGTTNFTFRVTGYLKARDGIVQESFYLRLSGTDANTYDQTVAIATIRPKIICTVAIPAPFYVNTESENFVITCDGPPEDEVYFTPVPKRGITFVPVGMSVGSAVKMDSTTSTGSFFAVSVLKVIGSFDVKLTISGKNAARYEAVPIVQTRTLPSAVVNVPPRFHFDEYATSVEVHVDLSAVPPYPLFLNLSVINNKTKLPAPADVKVFPTQLIYNSSNRATIYATGFTRGNYTIIYNISGQSAGNYLTPNTSSFEIRDRADGNAFTYRLRLGYQSKTACRVSVGMNSQVFYGQDEVALSDDFCDKMVVLARENSTGSTLCPSQPSEYRCREILATTGTVCYWYKNTCNYIEEMQGVAREFAYGSSFIAFVTHNSTVYTIGADILGQLGHNNPFNLTMVPIPESIASISVGTGHVLALADSGALYTWGGNSKGQLGITANVLQSTIVRLVEFPFGELITCVSAGAEHSGAVTTRGELYMWGSNEYGQLGQRATFRTKATSPIIATRETFQNEVVVSLQLGEFHTMVATDLSAYTFGSNNQGQLGRPGWDEWLPAQTLLWYPTKHIDRPTYPSYLQGKTRC